MDAVARVRSNNASSIKSFLGHKEGVIYYVLDDNIGRMFDGEIQCLLLNDQKLKFGTTCNF